MLALFVPPDRVDGVEKHHGSQKLLQNNNETAFGCKSDCKLGFKKIMTAVLHELELKFLHAGKHEKVYYFRSTNDTVFYATFTRIYATFL